MERRSFMKAVVASGLTGVAAHASAATTPGAPSTTGAPADAPSAAAALPRLTDPGELKGEMLYRKLGTTGETVSALGLGGFHIGKKTVAAADGIGLIQEAVDRGITFMDNCWDYNEGESERRMGTALKAGGRRGKVFLMTKLDGRTAEAATKQLDESLGRLQTDHLDLVQFHEILRFDDPDRVFAEGGAYQAMLAAKQAGKVRHIGFTGHKDPRIHLYMLDVAARHGVHFDTVQMPINVMDAHYRSFGQLVAPRAVGEGIGILGMKALGDGVILKSNTVSAVECLTFALSLPVSVQITGIDDRRSLDQAFAVATGFRPLDEAAMAALLARTEQAAANGTYELFKTSAFFDGTAKNPDWLGGDADAVKKLVPPGHS